MEGYHRLGALPDPNMQDRHRALRLTGTKGFAALQIQPVILLAA